MYDVMIDYIYIYIYNGENVSCLLYTVHLFPVLLLIISYTKSLCMLLEQQKHVH